MTKAQYIQLCIDSCEESGFFKENEITPNEIRPMLVQAFNKKLKELGVFLMPSDDIPGPLNDEELTAVLIRAMNQGVDNTIERLVQKEMLNLGVNADGDVTYTVNDKGMKAKDQYEIVKIIKGRR